MVVADQLHVCSMNLIIWRRVGIVLLQHTQVEELVILIVDHGLEVRWKISPTEFSIEPVANAIGRVGSVEDIVVAVNKIMKRVSLAPGPGLDVQSSNQVGRCTLH